jgi:hypothetical protein
MTTTDIITHQMEEHDRADLSLHQAIKNKEWYKQLLQRQQDDNDELRKNKRKSE